MRRWGARFWIPVVLAAALGCAEKPPPPQDKNKTAAARVSAGELSTIPARKSATRPSRSLGEFAGPGAARATVGDGRVRFDGDRRRSDRRGAFPSLAGGDSAVYAEGSGETKTFTEYTALDSKQGRLSVKEPPGPASRLGEDERPSRAWEPLDSMKDRSAGALASHRPKPTDDFSSFKPDSVPAKEPAARKEPRFLFIGDSQSVGGFGTSLDEMLRRDYPGSLVETYALGGANPMWFLPDTIHSGYKSPWTFFHYYEDGNPEKLVRREGKRATPLMPDILKPGTAVVLVALGSNLLTWKDSGIWAGQSVSDMAETITKAGARCVWISPADMKGPPKLKLGKEAAARVIAAGDSELKKRIAGRCDYIDVRVPYSGKDGVHLDQKTGRELAGKVLEEIKSRVPPP